MNALQYIQATVEPPEFGRPLAFEFNVLVAADYDLPDDDARDAAEAADTRKALHRKSELVKILRKHVAGLHVDSDSDLGGPSEPDNGGPAMYWFAASGHCSPVRAKMLAADVQRWSRANHVGFQAEEFLESYSRASQHRDGTVVTGTVEPSNPESGVKVFARISRDLKAHYSIAIQSTYDDQNRYGTLLVFKQADVRKPGAVFASVSVVGADDTHDDLVVQICVTKNMAAGWYNGSPYTSERAGVVFSVNSARGAGKVLRAVREALG